MSRSKKSRTSHKLQENKDNFEKPVEIEDEEDNSYFIPEVKKNKTNKNGSPNNYNDARSLDIPGHSTPVHSKSSLNDLEDSPEPDYRCSPILISCTQDVNEVAWDWHSSLSNPSEKGKTETEGINTPKRTKLLQKKRNSNSPLLYQPFRRKLVKAENIESIGKFAAELKALTEKMKSIQQNNKDHCVNKEDDKKGKVENHLEEYVPTSNRANISVNKISTSLEELFDESIEDSMVRCSQEVEEKLNLCSSKGSSTANSSNGSREKFLHANSSSENSKNSLFSHNSLVFNVSSISKTYSKNTPTRTTDSRMKIQDKKEEIMKKPSVNNNIVNTHNGNLQNRKSVARHDSSDLFEIPDDSFDDCLATCIEDEKLLSEPTEYDDLFLNIDVKSNKNGKNNKQSNLEKKYASKNLTKSSYSINFGTNQSSKDTLNRSVGKSSGMEGRKFFKTKSLSDSHFGQEKNTSTNSKASSSKSRQITKFFSHSNLPCKMQVNTTSCKNTANGNVYANKDIKSINEKESVYALTTGKIISEDSGYSMSKSNSTSGESQTMHCTPEEIEKKRLEAKMRLEAKRKIQMNPKNKTNVSEIPVKRVQR